MLSDNIQETASTKWVPCPRCGSKRVHIINKWYATAFFFVLCFILGEGGWLKSLTIICFLVGCTALFFDSRWHCKDCDYLWRKGRPKDYCFVKCANCGYKSLMFINQLDFRCPQCKSEMRKKGKITSPKNTITYI